MRKNNAIDAKIVNTRLTKISIAIFAPDERLPSSATLYSPNIDLKTCYENAPHLDHWGAIKTIIQMGHAFNPSKLKLLPYFEHSQFKHTNINPQDEGASVQKTGWTV